MKRYEKRKSLSPRHLMFAIWSLQKKHQRAAHFNELREYLSCSKEMLISGLWSVYGSIKTQDWLWFVVSDNNYIPMGAVSLTVRRAKHIKMPPQSMASDYGFEG